MAHRKALIFNRKLSGIQVDLLKRIAMGLRKGIWLIVFGVALLPCISVAQGTHYIYLQSENGRPFRIQSGTAIHQSGEGGYLLISQLKPGIYSFDLLLSDTGRSFRFQVPIDNRDRGFSLKLGLDHSWSLFDLVSFESLTGNWVALSKPVPAAPVSETTDNKTVIDADSAPAAVKPSQAKVKPSDTATGSTAIPVKSRPQTRAQLLPEVRKIYEKAGADGVDQVYIVSEQGRRDTIILFVPVIRPVQMAMAGSVVPPLPLVDLVGAKQALRLNKRG